MNQDLQQCQQTLHEYFENLFNADADEMKAK